MTFTTTYKTLFGIAEPVQTDNPVTKGYVQEQIGDIDIQDQLETILDQVQVVLIGDLVSESTATIPPVIMTEGNYTRVFVDQFGEIRSGTNLTFTSGNVQGTLNGGSVILNLVPTGVTAGTYGNSTTVPVVTVDSNGRVTNVTTSSVTVDTDFVLAADTGTSLYSLNQQLTIQGVANQIRTVVTGTTLTISLANDYLIFPGTITASAITANTVTSNGGFVGNIVGNVTGDVIGNVTGNIVGNITASSGTFQTLTSSGISTLGTIAETINTKTGAFGTVIHDFSQGAIWYHTGVTGNFTVDLIQVPTTTNRALGITFIIDQGSNGFIPNALRINGTSQTIRWVSGSTPVGTALKTEMVTFAMQRVNNAWIVTGSLASFG